MTFSIAAIIREFLSPKHILCCSSKLWITGLLELKKRGKGMRESGAFVLGTELNGRRRISRFVYYDDLEPDCLSTGVVVMSGEGYGPLWQLCKETGLKVVADIHTHPGIAHQSYLDKTNPMVATQGHIAIIVPNLAHDNPPINTLGVYEYRGSHKWHDFSGKMGKGKLYIGIWG
jgi:proteasome lid subunit RPN8/RPN11